MSKQKFLDITSSQEIIKTGKYFVRKDGYKYYEVINTNKLFWLFSNKRYIHKDNIVKIIEAGNENNT